MNSSFVRFVSSRNKDKILQTVSLVNDDWDKFLEMGYTDTISQDSEKHVHIWPRYMPEMSYQSIEFHVKEITDRLAIPLNSVFSFAKIGNKKSEWPDPLSLRQVVNELDEISRNPSYMRVVKNFVSLETTHEQKLNALIRARQAHPELYPREELELLPNADEVINHIGQEKPENEPKIIITSESTPADFDPKTKYAQTMHEISRKYGLVKAENRRFQMKFGQYDM